MTLPLIYALSNSNKSEARRVISIVKNNNNDNRKVAKVIKFVFDYGGIEYATARMNEYKDKALKILKEFPENEARNSLEDLVLYTVNREH